MDAGEQEEFDIDEAIEHGDEPDLMEVWRRAVTHKLWAISAESERQRGATKTAAVFEELSARPAPTALQALRANARLVEQLTEGRRTVMRYAREEGASWTEIGAALGMAKQSAHEWYHRPVVLTHETDGTES